MHPPSKRSADRATGSRRDLFSAARLRLSFFYVAVVAVIVTFFSSAVYFTLLKNLRDNVEEQIENGPVQARLIEQTAADLRTTIIVIDGVVLLASGLLGFVLAGRTLRPIKDALEAQKAFSSQASHELRTPLAIIQAESEVALRDHGASAEALRAALRSSLEEVGRMTAIVGQLLSLSRGEHGSRSAAAAVFDAPQIVAAACGRMRPLAEAKGLTLSCDAPGTVPMAGDPLRLEQALTNLMQNAVKYTSTGGVTVTLRLAGERVTISVADTGHGIPQNELPHVFEAFFTGERRAGEGERGVGLGLAIVRQIASEFGGAVSAESGPAGTVMRLDLPVIRRS